MSVPVNPTPKAQRSTEDLRAELTARAQSGDRSLLNRVQIAMIRAELHERAQQSCRAVVVVVEGHLLESGLWCDDCALPSAIRVAVTPESNPTVRLATLLVCTDCGRQEPAS